MRPGLGRLLPPCTDADAPAAAGCRLLLDTFHEHRDAQTRYFALMALAQIGGAHVRDLLLREFGRARGLDQPWLALALGVHAFDTRAAAARTTDRAGRRRHRQRAAAAAREVRSPAAIGALADRPRPVRLPARWRPHAAVPGHREAAMTLPDTSASGSPCWAKQGATAAHRDLVGRSTRRPDLLRQAAVALGVLGDKQAADLLVGMLGNGEGNLAQQAAISSALGFIGDRRSIRRWSTCSPTRAGSRWRAPSPPSRSAASPTRSALPWNSKIGCGTNYRAATETLTNGATGILDIL